MPLREHNVLNEILNAIRIERNITEHSRILLKDEFGERFLKAWELVKEGRIKRYIFRPSQRVVWIAIGKRGEYLIYPNIEYCGCNDFYFKVLEEEEEFCYHLLGQKLAEILRAYEQVEEEDEAYPILMQEWWKEIRIVA